MATHTQSSKVGKVGKVGKSGQRGGSAAPARKTARKSVGKAAGKTAAATTQPAFMRVARPDAIDFRDLPYRANVSVAPKPTLFPDIQPPVKNQGQTNACTGFSLSVVVEYLLARARREKAPSISPFMLYSMARRYDEYPGSVEDEGSSARGALKGWFKHGACDFKLFPAIDMPTVPDKIEHDWWFDAVKRPLGAYYRVSPKSLTDMHAALNEVGILYVTCGCHAGWDDGIEVTPLKKRPTEFKNIFVIPRKGGHAMHPGHAFVICGYNEQGFLIQNSWGTDWGSYGYAILTYDDWLDNAMDCWVAQLGVVTTEHEALAKSTTLRTDMASGRVLLSSSEVLRNREISPFIINMGNDGKLSNSGVFRTRADDVRAIADTQLATARKAWKLEGKPIDVCIYAHGGLVGEAEAAAVAAQWIPMLYEKKIFPVFLMWETGFWQTLLNCIEDSLKGVPRSAGGVLGAMERWWNQRLERLLSKPGHLIWDEMKGNAQAISQYHPGVPDDEQSGAVLLYQHFKHKVADQQVRLHFVGHSAGAIVASWMLDRLAQDKLMSFESMSLMAPAVTVADFDRLVRPHLASGALRRYQQLQLSERAEEDDPTCGPYRRSVLWLVSESFEGGATVPVLGMQRHFDPYAARVKLPNTKVVVAPGAGSQASTHAGFDEDPATRQTIVDFIRAG